MNNLRKQNGRWLILSVLLWGCERSTPQPLDAPAVKASTNATEPAGLPVADAAAEDAGQARDGNFNLDGSQFSLGQDTEGPGDGQRESQTDPDPAAVRASELANRFAQLQPVTTNSPTLLIAHLREIDSALQDLVLAGSSNFLDEKTFKEGGVRLGRMKQTAGVQLAESPEATPEQRKAGVISQLVALSHMSGLGDVSAAQELERFATGLAESGDSDLAHQARVVLIGFELQALQNGIHAEPALLLEQVAQLLPRPQDCGFPEFMVLQQSQRVLLQMGFTEAAEKVRQTLIEAYRTSPDAQLRGEAWLVETQGSQAYQNFVQAFRNLGVTAPGGDQPFDAAAALVAVRGLYEAFPTLQSLEQIASSVANIEYSGQVPLSQDVARFVTQGLASHSEADTSNIEKMLSAHTTRMALLGATLPLEGLVGFDGLPLEWSAYEGKVVLVDFWASWCLKCLREIPTIRKVEAEFADQGFAVLSINMDENLTLAKTFVDQQNFPWRSFHSQDLEALGFQSTVARQLGVNAIPLMILVGRDGRVTALHVRGEQLRPAVEKLIQIDP